MLYPDIQNGKEAIKAVKFQKKIGGTAYFMNIIMKSTKGYGKLSSNETLFDDI